MYPREWRERYGREMRELLDTRALSMRTIADLIAGAIDARVNPQLASSRNLGTAEGALSMSNVFRCSTHGIPVADQVRSGAWLIGGTLVMTAAAIVLRVQSGPNALSEALLYAGFPASLMLSTECTYLKRYSPAARRVMAIGGALLIVLMMWGAVALGNVI